MNDGDFDFDNNYNDNDGESKTTNGSYKNFFNSFDTMVGEDPKLHQEVLVVIDKRTKVERELEEDEFPTGILEAFVLPLSWSLERMTDIWNRAITEYMDINSWDKMSDLLLVYIDPEGHNDFPVNYKEKEKILDYG